MSERDLPSLLASAWDMLEEGARDAASPARLVTLATLGPEGPELRMLALRAARRGASLDLHTDARTPKVVQLRRDPRASVLAWHPGRQLQLRLRGTVELLEDGPEARRAWEEVPRAQRWNYGAQPPPGAPIARPDAYERAEAFWGFAILRLIVGQIDAVSLKAPHRRALYERGDGFAGTWLSP